MHNSPKFQQIDKHLSNKTKFDGQHTVSPSIGLVRYGSLHSDSVTTSAFSASGFADTEETSASSGNTGGKLATADVDVCKQTTIYL